MPASVAFACKPGALVFSKSKKASSDSSGWPGSVSAFVPIYLMMFVAYTLFSIFRSPSVIV